MSSRFFILQSEDVEQKFTTVHHCRHFTQEETGQASRRGRAPGRGRTVVRVGEVPLRGNLAGRSLFSHEAGVGLAMSVSCLEGTWPAPVAGSRLGPRGRVGDFSPPWGQLGGSGPC